METRRGRNQTAEELREAAEVALGAELETI
jgi:hypothetical protein